MNIKKKEITLKSSFEIILGRKREDYSDKVRRERWNYWKELASKKNLCFWKFGQTLKGVKGVSIWI